MSANGVRDRFSGVEKVDAEFWQDVAREIFKDSDDEDTCKTKAPDSSPAGSDEESEVANAEFWQDVAHELFKDSDDEDTCKTKAPDSSPAGSDESEVANAGEDDIGNTDPHGSITFEVDEESEVTCADGNENDNTEVSWQDRIKLLKCDTKVTGLYNCQYGLFKKLQRHTTKVPTRRTAQQKRRKVCANQAPPACPPDDWGQPPALKQHQPAGGGWQWRLAAVLQSWATCLQCLVSPAQLLRRTHVLLVHLCILQCGWQRLLAVCCGRGAAAAACVSAALDWRPDSIGDCDWPWLT
ncbi:hypothetical protein COO60DRAFT_1465006 [Scenedesmus sp. NREL 46B-D3]|nr:hypothetical protein COO60DRAFT_1465006 [Scenedesmus sp. NREL 46B-D3]